MRYSLIKFKVHGDHNGKLIALEKNDDFPFDIKRVYYIFDSSKDVIRGKHAHKNLQQVLICVNGSCVVDLDNGIEKTSVVLDNPYTGLYIKNNIWREMRDFSEDCVLLVLASDYYNEADYIRNYDEFLKFVEVKK